MRPIFEIVFLFALFSAPALSSNCSLNNEHNYISLSGPITQLLKSFKLLKDPSLKGISIFHQIDKSEYSGEFLGGGLFLSSKVVSKYKNPIIFIDESRELKKLSKLVPSGKIVTVRTRGLDSFEAYSETKKILTWYLRYCEKEVEEVDSAVLRVSTKIDKLKWNKRPALFFLGEKRTKDPNMLLNMDGPALILYRRGKLSLYPSRLPYLSWSKKILDQIRKEPDLLEFGLAYDIKAKDLIVKKIGSREFNLYGRTILIPGISQILFLGEFLEYFKNS